MKFIATFQQLNDSIRNKFKKFVLYYRWPLFIQRKSKAVGAHFPEDAYKPENLRRFDIEHTKRWIRCQHRKSLFQQLKESYYDVWVKRTLPDALDQHAVYIDKELDIALYLSTSLLTFHNPPDWLSPSEYALFLCFQLKRLAASLLIMHDSPHCDFTIPEFSFEAPKLLPNKPEIDSNFITPLFTGLLTFTEKAAKCSTQERQAELNRLLQQLELHYWHPERHPIQGKQRDTISVQLFAEHLQYLGLKAYLVHLQEHQNNLAPLIQTPSTLRAQLESASGYNQPVTDVWDNHQRLIDEWTKEACSDLRMTENDIEKKRHDYLNELDAAHLKYLRRRYHSDKNQGQMRAADEISISLNDAIDTYKQRIIKTERAEQQPNLHLYHYGYGRGFDLRTPAEKKRDEEQKAKQAREKAKQDREKAQQDIAIKSMCYFSWSVQEHMTQQQHPGHYRNPATLETQTQLLTDDAIQASMQALIERNFPETTAPAEALQAQYQNAQREQDKTFATNLHYLLKYLPIMERTHELKALYNQRFSFEGRKRDISINPGSYIAHLVIALHQLYTDPQTKDHERVKLCKLVQDITDHQMGKTHLDVRFLKKSVLAIHEHYHNEPRWHKVLGVLLILAAIVILTTTIMLAIAALSAPAIGITLIPLIATASMAAKTAIGALAITFGTIGTGTSLTLGIINTRNRPFFRADRFKRIQHAACELSYRGEYEYFDNQQRTDAHCAEHSKLLTDVWDDFVQICRSHTLTGFTEHWVYPDKNMLKPKNPIF